MIDHRSLLEAFKLDLEHSQSSLREFKQAKAYYHGNQLPPDVLHIITQRGQTPIVEKIH
ncbi:portal protein, partial [Helicobacter salomonis]